MYNRLINFKSGDPESMTKLGQRWQTVVYSSRLVHNVAGTNLGSTASCATYKDYKATHFLVLALQRWPT